MTLHAQDEIRETAATRHRDYILTDYEPPCDPVGKLHPVSAYRHGLRAAGQLEALWPLVERVRAHLGPEQTVWGLKYTPAGVRTELYFYNNRNNPPGHPMQVGTLARVLEGQARFDSRLDESLPYFMCSLELDAAALAADTPLQFCVYVGSGDQKRTPSGFSYRVCGSEFRLENHYAFYYAARPDELADARARLTHSTRAGGPDHWRQLVPDYLTACRTICYAIKPRHDGLYFSRLSTDQLAQFLAEHLPEPFASLLDSHAGDLAHLRWDLGYDFCIPRDSTQPLTLDKIGIYGVL